MDSTDDLHGLPTGTGQMLDYNGFDIGNLTLTIPTTYTGQSTLYYNCEYHDLMKGQIFVVDTPAQAAAPIHTFSIILIVSMFFALFLL